MNFGLRDSQIEALGKMKNGCILCGNVGSGKSRTALAYYFKKQGGDIQTEEPMPDPPKDLYIITTARKRDTKEWELDMAPFFLSSDPNLNIYNNTITVDSWNNIQKYVNVKNAFFIFDEQRVVGSGKWVRAFLKITKVNDWILLSATPGDKWTDYVPVFMANGFYKNRSEFERAHVVYNRYVSYKKVDKYLNIRRLERLRRIVLVDMPDEKITVTHDFNVFVDFDKRMYKKILKERWNYQKDKPIENASELCYELRRVSNSHPDRLKKTLDIAKDKGKVIIFYNFDYELDLLKDMFGETDFDIAEWNGHKHQEIPDGSKWVYLVQYIAGAEGWNCIKTDTIIFYSQNYSYRTLEQAKGRINRLNTPFIDLYFYMLKSHSNIDLAISQAIREKRKFNECRFANF